MGAKTGKLGFQNADPMVSVGVPGAELAAHGESLISDRLGPLVVRF